MANAGATLRAGFTTVRDVGTYRGGIDVSLWNAIDQGQVPGPRMAVAGPCVTKPGGGGEVTGPPNGAFAPPEFRLGAAASPEEVRAPVAEILGRGANFIKVIATGAVLTVGTDVGAMECSEAALRAGVRSIEHGSLLDDEGIALMAERGTWLVADIYNGDYIKVIGRRDHWPEETLRKNDETTETQRATSRKAVAAGVRIGYDADVGGYPHGENAKQFQYMVRYGMTPMQAIQSATIEAARPMGWEERVGSMAVGKWADLVAVRGHPIQDISIQDISTLEQVDIVIKGRSIPRNGETSDEQCTASIRSGGGVVA
ncbi:MAG: amidohydrolase family protein [Gemmatimonadetes bacterium]|nr:amidohydrolase family protein [Gemmatimonadota bacterium]